MCTKYFVQGRITLLSLPEKVYSGFLARGGAAVAGVHNAGSWLDLFLVTPSSLSFATHYAHKLLSTTEFVSTAEA